MRELRVEPAELPLAGDVVLPADKSIAHRALLLAAIAEGTSRVGAAQVGGDVLATAEALHGLGVSVDRVKDAFVVAGVGVHGLAAPSAALDCENAGTSMRLLAGLLAGQSFPFRLVGDASLSRRPMRRIVAPLVARGARVQGTSISGLLAADTDARDVYAPLFGPGLAPGTLLEPLHWDLETASAQVKSALLFSGLYASGPTVLQEPYLSRDHTERMFRALGIPLRREDTRVVLDLLHWDRRIPAFDVQVPGDLSAGAFLLAAAALVPGSRVTLTGVGVNETRTGVLEWMQDAQLCTTRSAETEATGEPTATLTFATGVAGTGADLSGGRLVRAIDEVPAICAMAAVLDGVTTISDAHELRVKESDRLRSVAAVLRAFGIRVEERPAGLVIEGRPEGRLRACAVDSHADHRIAMMAAILSLRADGPSVVRDVDCISTSFPGFVSALRSIGARVYEATAVP